MQNEPIVYPHSPNQPRRHIACTFRIEPTQSFHSSSIYGDDRKLEEGVLGIGVIYEARRGYFVICLRMLCIHAGVPMAVFEEDGRLISGFLRDLAEVQTFGAELHASGRIGLDGLIDLYQMTIDSNLPRNAGFVEMVQCTACGIADPHVRLYMTNTVPGPPLFSTVSVVDYLVRICRAGVFSKDVLDGLLGCSSLRMLSEHVTGWDETMRCLDTQRFRHVAEIAQSGKPVALGKVFLPCGEILVQTVMRLTKEQIHLH